VSKRSLFSPPDDFSISPLLSLLPTRGDVNRLSSLNASLFARHEKVVNSTSRGGEDSKRIASEEAMLRQVLEWLEIKADV